LKRRKRSKEKQQWMRSDKSENIGEESDGAQSRGERQDGRSGEETGRSSGEETAEGRDQLLYLYATIESGTLISEGKEELEIQRRTIRLTRMREKMRRE
jgi:hypothetical protein